MARLIQDTFATCGAVELAIAPALAARSWPSGIARLIVNNQVCGVCGLA
jgi:hypothetical protein